MPNRRGKGIAEIWRQPDGPRVCELLARTRNTWTYEYSHPAAMLLAAADPRFVLSVLYVEFENVATPSTVSVSPTVTRDQGLSYYLGLGTSATRDFLRIPLAFPAVPSRDGDYAGTQYLRPGLFNRLTLTAIASAGAGMNAKTFSNASNSKVVGVAAASTPDPDDVTQDIVFARAYYASGGQVLLPATGSLVVTYSPTFQ